MLKAGVPLMAAVDPVRMMELPSGRSGSAFCTVKTVPFTFVANVLSKCSSVIAPRGANSPPPALAQSTSIRPASALMAANKASRSESLETSLWMPVALLPICRNRLVELLLAPARHENPGPFASKPLRGRQADAAVRTGDDGDLSIEPSHRVISWQIADSDKRRLKPRMT